MIKVKVAFCQYWFMDKEKNTPVYKLHFFLNEVQTAYVISRKQYNAGAEISLVLSLGKDGRCSVSIAE